MAAKTRLSYYLAERPDEQIVPGKTFATKIEKAPTSSDLKDGEALLEALYLSIDPSVRRQIGTERTYSAPMEVGSLMRGYVLSRVLSSKAAKVQAGDLVCSPSGWTEVAIVPEAMLDPVILPKNANITDALGILGGNGLTAYFGMTKIACTKPGETVVVSAAAGATGLCVGQIAKIFGARVIGITGTDEKCAILRDELGFDTALNYNSSSFAQDLATATPDYIDVYWDNVGGHILDLALERAAKFSRFVMCGSISLYNGSSPPRMRNLQYIASQRITMRGFIIFDYISDILEARNHLTKWFIEGKLQPKEHIVKGGLKEVENAVGLLFKGRNVGKVLLEVKPPGQL